MPAAYPTSVKVFSTKQDRVDVVEAIDVDDLQDEMRAVQSILGINPHISPVYGQAATVSARMAAADAVLSTLAGYFTSQGMLSQSQITGLGDVLTSLTNGVNNAATVSALQAAISGVNGNLSSEASARTSADNNLQSQINSLSGSTSSGSSSLQDQINQEITNRQTADNNEATTRAGVDNALSSRATALENRFKSAEAQYQNNSARNYTSNGTTYQSLYLPNQSFLTNDFGSTHGDGHTLVTINGPQTRFYTDFSGSSDIYALTVTVTWQGTGGTSNAGVRGLRIQTAGGSTLAEFIKNANQDPNDEALSVCFIGRLSGGSNYYITPQVFQNSGGTLSLRGHTTTTPTFATFTRIPG